MSTPDSETHSGVAIGERLEIARELAGISARELDRLAGRPEGHARLIERGERPKLELDTVTDYAAALGLDLNWLVRGAGREPSARAVRAAVEAARERAGDVSDENELPRAAAGRR